MPIEPNVRSRTRSPTLGARTSRSPFEAGCSSRIDAGFSGVVAGALRPSLITSPSRITRTPRSDLLRHGSALFFQRLPQTFSFFNFALDAAQIFHRVERRLLDMLGRAVDYVVGNAEATSDF